MEFVGKERSGWLEIKATSKTREKLKKFLETPYETLFLVSALVYGDTECGIGGARNIHWRAEGVNPKKGTLLCSKEEYESLCEAHEIPNNDERILSGETVILIVKDGDIVDIC